MRPMSSSDDVAATDAIAAEQRAVRAAGRAGPRSLKQPSSAAFKPANMSGKACDGDARAQPRDRRAERESAS